MEKVFLLGQVEISIKASMLMMNGMETDKCYGLMEACTKENGKKEYSMV